MRQRRTSTLQGRGTAIAATLIVLLVLSYGGVNSVRGQESTMDQRFEELLGGLEGADCASAKVILDLAKDVTHANMRVVSTRGEPITDEAHQMMSRTEMRAANALAKFAQQGRCPEERGRALDLKLLIEQQNEVARAVSPFTAKCGPGSSLLEPPCDQLQPVLDEATGHEFEGEDRKEKVVPKPGQKEPIPSDLILRPGFSVKLRGPFVPPYVRHAEEDVRVTEPINPGQCVVVFKETRGLMLRLTLIRMDVVKDPWATPMLARGTRIPVWALQWVPAEYVKEWNICNEKGRIVKSVTQRVKQDIPLHYFWRYFPRY